MATTNKLPSFVKNDLNRGVSTGSSVANNGATTLADLLLDQQTAPTMSRKEQKAAEKAENKNSGLGIAMRNLWTLPGSVASGVTKAADSIADFGADVNYSLAQRNYNKKKEQGTLTAADTNRLNEAKQRYDKANDTHVLGDRVQKFEQKRDEKQEAILKDNPNSKLAELSTKGLELAESAGRMLPSIGVSIATGGLGAPAALAQAAGLGAMWTEVYDNSMDEAIAGGADVEKASQKAALDATVEAGTELLFGGIAGTGKGIINADRASRSLAKLSKDAFTKETLEHVSGETLGVSLAKSVVSVLERAEERDLKGLILRGFGEATEEMISEAVGPCIERATTNPNASDATFGQIAEAGLGGMLLSVVLAPFGGLVNRSAVRLQNQNTQSQSEQPAAVQPGSEDASDVFLLPSPQPEGGYPRLTSPINFVLSSEEDYAQQMPAQSPEPHNYVQVSKNDLALQNKLFAEIPYDSIREELEAAGYDPNASTEEALRKNFALLSKAEMKKAEIDMEIAAEDAALEAQANQYSNVPLAGQSAWTEITADMLTADAVKNERARRLKELRDKAKQNQISPAQYKQRKAALDAASDEDIATVLVKSLNDERAALLQEGNLSTVSDFSTLTPAQRDKFTAQYERAYNKAIKDGLSAEDAKAKATKSAYGSLNRASKKVNKSAAADKWNERINGIVDPDKVFKASAKAGTAATVYGERSLEGRSARLNLDSRKSDGTVIIRGEDGKYHRVGLREFVKQMFPDLKSASSMTAEQSIEMLTRWNELKEAQQSRERSNVEDGRREENSGKENTYDESGSGAETRGYYAGLSRQTVDGRGTGGAEDAGGRLDRLYEFFPADPVLKIDPNSSVGKDPVLPPKFADFISDALRPADGSPAAMVVSVMDTISAGEDLNTFVVPGYLIRGLYDTNALIAKATGEMFVADDISLEEAIAAIAHENQHDMERLSYKPYTDYVRAIHEEINRSLTPLSPADRWLTTLILHNNREWKRMYSISEESVQLQAIDELLSSITSAYIDGGIGNISPSAVSALKFEDRIESIVSDIKNIHRDFAEDRKKIKVAEAKREAKTNGYFVLNDTFASTLHGEVSTGADGMYSNIEVAIRKLSDKQLQSATPADIERYLKKPGSMISREELDRSGMIPALRALDKRSHLTRDQLLTMLRENDRPIMAVVTKRDSAPYVEGGQRPRFADRSLPGGNNYQEILVIDNADDLGNYVGQHWDEENVLFHLRMADHETSTGERVLFIDEIQSDLHNDILKEPDSYGPAPYAGRGYVRYGVEKALQVAAEGGYDYLAWATPEMQEIRWSDDYRKAYQLEYGEQIPAFLRDYTKQFGVDGIGAVALVTHPDSESTVFYGIDDYELYDEIAEDAAKESLYYENYDTIQAPAIPITPELSDAILTYGQPRYAGFNSLDVDAVPISDDEIRALEKEYSVDTSPIFDDTTVWGEKIDEFGAKPAASQQNGKAFVSEEYTNDVPKAVSEQRRISDIVQDFYQDSRISDAQRAKIREAVLHDDIGVYDATSNKKQIQRAQDKMKGYTNLFDAFSDWKSLARQGLLSNADNMVWSQVLSTEFLKAINDAEAQGVDASTYMDARIEIMSEMAVVSENAAQIVQCMRVVNSLGPVGEEQYSRKVLEQYNKKLGTDIKVPDTIWDQMRKAETEEQISNARDALATYVAGELNKKHNLKDWVKQERYTAMLLNPVTHIRNIVSNAINTVNVVLKDTGGGVIEDVFRSKAQKGDRTKTLKGLFSANPELNAWVEADWKNPEIQAAASGAGKYSGTRTQDLISRIEQKRDYLLTDIGNKASHANSWLLEAEDELALGFHYKFAMKQYLLANGITVEEIKTNTQAVKDMLGRARAYAISEAQHATYRNATTLGKALTQLEKTTGTAGEIILGSLIPFKNTPINIAVQGMKYSPLGIAKAIQQFADVMIKGDKSVYTFNQAIDNLSAGLTGTGVFLLGAFLRSLGMVKAGGSDDDREEYFDQMRGNQRYSLQLADWLGGGSFTLDWATPTAIALFAGAEAENYLEAAAEAGESNADFTDLCNGMLDAASRMADPMLEMSFLSGLNDAITSMKNDGLKALPGTILANYASQLVPTLGGRVASIIDPTVHSTYASADSHMIGGQTTEKTLRKLANKVPGLGSKVNAPSVDYWGNVKTNSDSTIESVIENLVSPGYYVGDRSLPVDYFLDELAQATGDTNVYPTSLPYSFSYGGENYVFDNDSYSENAIIKGRIDLLGTEQVRSSNLAYELTLDELCDVVNSVHTFANNVAKESYLAGQGVAYSNSTISGVEEALANGINIGDYFIIKKKLSSYTGDGKKKKQEAYLSSLGMNANQIDVFI